MKPTLTFVFLLFWTFASLGQTSFSDAQKKANDDATNKLRLNYNRQKNLWTDREGTIHLFLDENGNTLLSGYPTTATENNKFQLHLYLPNSNTSPYRLEIVGSYEPVLNIDVANKSNGLAADIVAVNFSVAGPFTNSVVFTLKHFDGKDFTVINSATVKIAKTIHASVGTGFVYSTLRNPTNIRVVPLNNINNQSTLLADNTAGDATLALIATLYPWGRNSLMLQNGLKDRLGVALGTTIASTQKNFKNLYLGLQYDFTIGGSFVAGVNIANQQKILGVDYKTFNFGETVFTGKVEDKLYMKVGVGFFVGIQVDSRIFAKMFASNP